MSHVRKALDSQNRATRTAQSVLDFEDRVPRQGMRDKTERTGQ
jgi:hypothetical protein